MSAEALPPPEPDNLPPREQVTWSPFVSNYVEAVSDIWTPDKDLTDFNRPSIAVATALFIRDTVQTDSKERNKNGLQDHPLIPELLVTRSIRAIWDEMHARPTHKIEIAQRHSEALKTNKASVRYYSFQIYTTLELANDLQQTEHPLAPCATDVLLGYGKALANLKH